VSSKKKRKKFNGRVGSEMEGALTNDVITDRSTVRGLFPCTVSLIGWSFAARLSKGGLFFSVTRRRRPGSGRQTGRYLHGCSCSPDMVRCDDPEGKRLVHRCAQLAMRVLHNVLSLLSLSLSLSLTLHVVVKTKLSTCM